jgi:hypothetical protein
VLDEMVPFLEGPVLHEGERDAFFLPVVSDKQREPVRPLRAGARPKPRAGAMVCR